MTDKFIYIQEDSTEGVLIAQDGGVATIWHNGEHLVGQGYKERLQIEDIKIGFSHAFETMAGVSSDSSMFDFEDEHKVHPTQLQVMAEWLVFGRNGDFFDNITVINVNEVTEDELNKKILEFLESGVTQFTESLI